MEVIEIPQEEVKQLIQNQVFHTFIKKAYQATIPNLSTRLEEDPRFNKNTHFVNKGFLENPIFLLAGYVNLASHTYVVSAVYVYPEHRNQGISKLIFRYLADRLPENISIHLSVEESKLTNLDPYYKSLGFQTTGVKVWNPTGGNLVDYFWCKCYLELSMMNNNQHVAVQLCGLRPPSEWELYQ